MITGQPALSRRSPVARGIGASALAVIPALGGLASSRRALSQDVPGPKQINLEDWETVPSMFKVEIENPNVTVSNDLLNKNNIPGFGVWHVFVGTSDPMALMEEAMMGMQKDMQATSTHGAMTPMPMSAYVSTDSDDRQQ